MERNIFEASANKAKKSLLSSTNRPGNPLPITKKDIQNYGNDDPEVVKMFARMHEMQSNLEDQLEQIRKKGEELNFDVDAYIKNTVHFRPLEIEKITNDQKKLEQEVDSLLAPETCLTKLKKSASKLTQERKNKTLGSRKKWIPIK